MAGAQVAPVDGISIGLQVRVRIPKNAPCAMHCLDSVPVLDAAGTVEHIVAEWDNPTVVRFDLWHLGVQWVDRFTSDELVLVEVP